MVQKRYLLFLALGWSPSSRAPCNCQGCEVPAPPGLCGQKSHWYEHIWDGRAGVGDQSLALRLLCNMVDGATVSASDGNISIHACINIWKISIYAMEERQSYIQWVFLSQPKMSYIKSVC
jgi:hypothetical protein